jgi:hypothetical protein
MLKESGREEKKEGKGSMEYRSIVWLHDHNKRKRKIDVNTLEVLKEIKSGQLNSYGGIEHQKSSKTTMHWMQCEGVEKE